MMRKASLLIVLFLTVLLPAQAQTDEEIVKSIKDDIQAVKAKMRDTRNQLRDQERELRQLNTELERTRATIQQNKQRARDAKKSGKAYVPKPVERSYKGASASKSQTASATKADTATVGKKREASAKRPDKKTEQLAKDSGNANLSAAQNKKKDILVEEKDVEKREKCSETPKVAEKQSEKQVAPPAASRRVSDKEALRLQKQRNKYYERQLKEKQKAAKKDAKARQKMEKEKKKAEPPVASARRQRDTKEKENEDAEGAEE